MNKQIKIAVLVALGLAGVTAARAQSTDILLGFNDYAGPSGANNDYVVDLGTTGAGLVADAVGNGGTYSLSSLVNWSTFNTAFSADSSRLNNVAVGLVNGYQVGSTKYIFQTVAVGSTPPAPYSGQFANTWTSAQSPTIGEYSSSSTSGWTYNVAQSPGLPGTANLITGSDVAENTGNPLGQLSSGVLALNLWEDTKHNTTISGWVNVGTFNINLNTDTASFTVAAPEPSTYGVLAGFGLLAFTLRNQIKIGRKTA
jgi:hypothetical protein